MISSIIVLIEILKNNKIWILIFKMFINSKERKKRESATQE